MGRYKLVNFATPLKTDFGATVKSNNILLFTIKINNKTLCIMSE